MGRWSVFLTLVSMLFPAVVHAHDCPLNGQEEHAWLIRLTPMLPIEEAAEGSPGGGGGSGGATDTGKGGGSPAPPPAKVFKFHDVNDGDSDAGGLEQNLRYRRKRDDPPKPAEDAKASEKPGVQPSAAPGRPANQPERGKVVLEPGVTAMHGALVTPEKVLTVLGINLDGWFSITMKKGYLSLVGYNAGKKCSQEQWGFNVTSPDFDASFALNPGLFLIINTYEPFAVDGEPFLFGSRGYPPVEDIIPAYHSLAKNPEGKVMMHLFKDKKTIMDASTVDVEFNFMPWKTCGVMPSVNLALSKEGKGLHAQVASDHFFCSMGIPGIENETMGGETEKFGFDWYRGAPVIYTKEDQTKLPIGYYVYRVGLSGDPRIYATYNSRLSQILGGPGVVNGSLTLPPPDSGESPVPEPGSDEGVTEPHDEIETSPRRLRAHPAPSKPANKGSHVTIAEIWVVLMCTSTSAAHFT